MNEHENNNGKGGMDDLQKLMMAGLGAVVQLKEKSAQWIDELSEKGKQVAPDVQATLDEMAQKGKQALEHGKTFSAEAMAKLQKSIDNLSEEAKQRGLDDLIDQVDGLADEALHTLKGKIEDLISMRNSKPDCECPDCECPDCECPDCEDAECEYPDCESEDEQP